MSIAGRSADPRSLRRQLVALTALLSTLVALALVTVVGVVLERSSSTAVDRVLADRAAAVVASADRSTSTTPQVPDESLDPGVAVYDAGRALVRGQVPPSLEAAFASLSGTDQATVSEVDEDYQVLAHPFSHPGRGRGRGRRGGAVGALRGRRPYGPARRGGRRRRDRGAGHEPGRLGQPASPGARRRDGTHGRAVERTRPRAPLRPRRADDRDPGLGSHPRRPAGQGRRRDPGRAAPHLRAGPRAAHPPDRGAGDRPGGGAARRPRRPAAGRPRRHPQVVPRHGCHDHGAPRPGPRRHLRGRRAHLLGPRRRRVAAPRAHRGAPGTQRRRTGPGRRGRTRPGRARAGPGRRQRAAPRRPRHRLG